MVVHKRERSVGPVSRPQHNSYDHAAVTYWYLRVWSLRSFEGTAVEIVDGCLVLGSVIGNELAYGNFSVTTAVKCSYLLKKLGQVAKTSPRTFKHASQEACSKFFFRVPENAKLTEYLHRRRSQHPNARPTVVLWLSGASLRTAIVLTTIPGGRNYIKGDEHQGANRLRKGVRCFADRMLSSWRCGSSKWSAHPWADNARPTNRSPEYYSMAWEGSYGKPLDRAKTT